MVLTDRDIYLQKMQWRFAFAASQGAVTLVSLARMDPAFPLEGPASYVPQRPACDVVVRARAFKMITRELAFAACGAEQSDAPASLRRRSLLALDDLDRIEEATW